jgi:hypothetical protein
MRSPRLRPSRDHAVVLGPDGRRVGPVTDYLTELLAGDCSPLTLKSYAYDLA